MLTEAGTSAASTRIGTCMRYSQLTISSHNSRTWLLCSVFNSKSHRLHISHWCLRLEKSPALTFAVRSWYPISLLAFASFFLGVSISGFDLDEASRALLLMKEIRSIPTLACFFIVC